MMPSRKPTIAMGVRFFVRASKTMFRAASTWMKLPAAQLPSGSDLRWRARARRAKSIDIFLMSGYSLAKILAREYPDIKKISIDFALLEHAQNVVVAHGDFVWDDLAM